MKLWQYAVITVLMTGAFIFGTGWGYNDGYDSGYVDGSFDEGWHAAVQLNEPYAALGNITFSYSGDAWHITTPNYDGTYAKHFYNSDQDVWLSED